MAWAGAIADRESCSAVESVVEGHAIPTTLADGGMIMARFWLALSFTLCAVLAPLAASAQDTAAFVSAP